VPSNFCFLDKTVKLLDKLFSWAGFVLLAAVVIISSWLFAGWEMWLFWPFVAMIFCATFFFSIRLILGRIGFRSNVAGAEEPGIPELEKRYREELSIRNGRLLRFVLLSFLAFLAYAFTRFMQSDVYMDAERSFLLFLAPFLVGVMVVFGFDRKQLRLMYGLVLANLFCLGLYGVINHLGWESKHVLWRPGYTQYVEECRATGSYFCPDHFSGIMELAFCLSMGMLLARGGDWKQKISAGVICLTALMGIILSKSRGGGLTVVVLVVLVLAAGFYQWPVAVRWYWRLATGGLLVLLLVGFCSVETAYMTRFKEHFGWSRLHGKPVKEMLAGVKASLVASSRGQMISGALRAWKTAPVFGIGAGMHQNLWPHFAASPDGDRAMKEWPTFWNNTFHSYEVHSDWVQLLEEYGITGLVLFLVSFISVLAVLFAGIKREIDRRRDWDWDETCNDHYGMVLGAVFACAAMAFHSLGDFNLQMPATAWLMAVIVAIPMAHILNDPGTGS